MKVLLGEDWRDGFLDAHRDPSQVRIEVLACLNLERIDGLYFVRPRSWRLVLNYVREIGPIAVARKVASRRDERHRNRKYVSVGIGRVLEADNQGNFASGARVAFLAPCHPACAERLVLPAELLSLTDVALPAASAQSGILHLGEGRLSLGNRWWTGVTGWDHASGRPITEPRSLMRHAEAALAGVDWSSATSLSRGHGPVAEVRSPAVTRDANDSPRATLLGYGNYAKTMVLPNVRPFLDVTRVHEVDPTQIPLDGSSLTWDTAPTIRPEEHADAFLIAGYHHTHAPLAVEALRRGSYAVVEKPVVTQESQLAALRDEVQRNPRFFACFHKRYLALNDLARRDLGVADGEAISYHCTVFEVPLPPLHWYRWPASRSRLISNGCHWTDHFLFLNGFAHVAWFDLAVAGDGTINCSIELQNGAFFTMVLTDRGSSRVGVQDHVELRANDVTVRMENGSRYESERSDRRLRRTRIDKYSSYRQMYRTIGRRIQEGAAGDSLSSLEVSNRLMLDLERRLHEVLGSSGAIVDIQADPSFPEGISL